MTMKYSHSNYPADKMKVRKVIWVHSTVWINLKRIDIIPGITDLKVRLKLHKGQNEKKMQTLPIFELNYLEY